MSNMIYLVTVIVASLTVGAWADCSEREAYVLIAANEAELIRCTVVARSLRAVSTTKEVVVVVNSNAITKPLREFASGEFDEVYDVELPESMSAADMHLVVSVRPEAVRTLATLYAWRLTDFKKMVLLANNVMAVRNPDDLFLQPSLSAVADVFLSSQTFDPAVIVAQPSLSQYDMLLRILAQSKYTWNAESVLNTGFPQWNHLSDDYLSEEFLPQTNLSGIDSNSKLVALHESPATWTDIYDEQTETLITSSKFTDLSVRQLWWSIFSQLNNDFAVKRHGVSATDSSTDTKSNTKPSARFDAGSGLGVRKRSRRAAGGSCSITCWKGSCSCGGHSCTCRCRFGKPVCTAAFAPAPSPELSYSTGTLSLSG